MEKSNIMIRLEKIFGMCIVQDALSIMYCISSEMTRHLFQNWIL